MEKMKLKSYGYSEENGMTTDVMTLKQNGLAVACANISCGYYNPHTPDEYTNFAELENCLDFIEHAFVNIHEVCRHKHVAKYDIGYTSRGMNSKYPFMGKAFDDDLPEPDGWKDGMNGYGSAYMRK